MSPSVQALWLTGIGGFFIGVAITWLLTRSSGRQQQELDEAKAQLQQYRRQVEQHFVATADAVDELNRSYQKVFEQLGRGAEELLDAESYRREAEKRAGRSITLNCFNHPDAGATAPPPERPVPADAPELPQNTLEDSNAASNASPVFPAAAETKENAADASRTPPVSDANDKKP